MNVKNCKNCGRIFNYFVGPPLCPACRDEMEATFQRVKKYVQENKGCTIADVAEACEVDSKQIRQWIREERLEFSDDSMIGIGCEKCGTTIKSGRFCDKCKAEMTNGFRNAMTPTPAQAPARSAQPDKNNPKMRFF